MGYILLSNNKGKILVCNTNYFNTLVVKEQKILAIIGLKNIKYNY